MFKKTTMFGMAFAITIACGACSPDPTDHGTITAKVHEDSELISETTPGQIPPVVRWYEDDEDWILVVERERPGTVSSITEVFYVTAARFDSVKVGQPYTPDKSDSRTDPIRSM